MDPLDDIFAETTAKNASRAGGRFQPKVKPRPPQRKVQPSLAPPSVAPSKSDYVKHDEPAEKPLTKNDERKSSDLAVNFLPGHFCSQESLAPIDGLDASHDVVIPQGNEEDWHSCFDKEAGENADIFIGLESFDDFLPHSTAVMESSVPPETTADQAPVAGNQKGPHGVQNASPINGSAFTSNIGNVPEASSAQGPLTCEEHVSIGDAGCHVDDRGMESEDFGSFSLETLDMSELSTLSGKQGGKFQPKPKIHTHKEISDTSNPGLDRSSSGLCQKDSHSIPVGVDFSNKGSLPSHDDVLDLSSIGFNDVSGEDQSGNLLNDEPTTFINVSHLDVDVGEDQLEAVSEVPEEFQNASTSGQGDEAGSTLRQRRNRMNGDQLEDQYENETLDNEGIPAECYRGSDMNEDDHNNEDFQVENESEKKRGRRNSKKTSSDKEKTVKKHKKSNEALDKAAKPKKFPHSTRQKRRRVDKTLLETPEDEIDYQKVPLRDLILLAEHRERLSKKEAAPAEAPKANQSASYSAADHYEDDAFPSGHDEEYDGEQASPKIEESSGYFNYQTFMDKTPIARWSKQDTELFYEAVRQFGTDLSMIQQLFPGLTRRQVKLKFKKEERQHPLRLREALTSRAKDHSHFERVIEHLKQIAAEEKRNSSKEDETCLAGDMEVGEESHETNDEDAKAEHMEEEVEVQDIGPQSEEVPSPAKSYDSDEDMFRWSQYKSEV